jgi:hypothetical protein
MLTGELAHRTLASCLPGPSERTIREAAFATCAPVSQSPALRNRVTNLALRYVRSFHPVEPARLVAVELSVPDTRCDVVWERDNGVWVDEIKTSGAASLRQLRRLIAAGGLCWEDRFLGVRVVLLHHPAGSFLVRSRRR